MCFIELVVILIVKFISKNLRINLKTRRPLSIFLLFYLFIYLFIYLFDILNFFGLRNIIDLILVPVPRKISPRENGVVFSGLCNHFEVNSSFNIKRNLRENRCMYVRLFKERNCRVNSQLVGGRWDQRTQVQKLSLSF